MNHNPDLLDLPDLPDLHAHWLDTALRFARAHEHLTTARRARLEHDIHECVIQCRAYDITGGWDQSGPPYVCDIFMELFIDYWHGDHRPNRYLATLECCLRASLNLIIEQPYLGVIGYTIGHIRRMYPEGFPVWLEEKIRPEAHTWPDEQHIGL
jgi:hypothetical protein